MVSGIYGGDAKKIVMRLAFPLFAGFDEKFNSFLAWGFFSFFKKSKSIASPLDSILSGMALEYLPLSLVKKIRLFFKKETSVLSLSTTKSLAY